MVTNKWVDEFCNIAKSAGLECKVINCVHGWTETIQINNLSYFTKSMTYNLNRQLYFEGVDPKKLNDNGDKVFLCGGLNGQLKDIFIIPWDVFFTTLKAGKLINTYRPPREYYQYKFKVRDRDSRWIMSVQGGKSPKLDITKWRFDVSETLSTLKK